MEDIIQIVKDHYDSNVEKEWSRLETHPFEFALTTRMMDRYIKPGDKVLDIGGGPGRYSLYYAQKGCEVTLFDLSIGNVNYAMNKSAKLNLNIKGVIGDAREVDKLVEGTFDHIFIMGPMYHLFEEKDREKAINAALSLLKEGGLVYISFLLMFSGMIYGMKYMPELVLQEPEQVFINAVLKDESYGGDAFTKAFFTSKKDMVTFLAKFKLEKLHLFGQEGILSPCEERLLAQPQEVMNRWIEIAEKLCDREEFLSYSEHVMFVGRKKS